jgi:hypothetical protein
MSDALTFADPRLKRLLDRAVIEQLHNVPRKLFPSYLRRFRPWWRPGLIYFALAWWWGRSRFDGDFPSVTAFVAIV